MEKSNEHLVFKIEQKIKMFENQIIDYEKRKNISLKFGAHKDHIDNIDQIIEFANDNLEKTDKQLFDITLECSRCGMKTFKLIYDVWNSKKGQIIGKDERLCESCANKRGYKNLQKINSKRSLNN